MVSRGNVTVVDDDPAVRDALTKFLTTVGFTTRHCSSGEEFLEAVKPDDNGCVVVDLRLTGMSGLQILDRLRETQSALRCVVLTGHGDIPAAVSAVRNGAVQFLEKPCPSDSLLLAVEQAIRESESPQANAPNLRAQLLGKLTPNEQDVFRATIAGLTNAEMAEKFDISLRTVQFRRASMMRKLGVQTRGEILRRAWEVGFTPDDIGSAKNEVGNE